MDEDEQLARAIAASLGQDNGHQPASAASASSTQPAGDTISQHVEAARPAHMGPQVLQSSGQSLQGGRKHHVTTTSLSQSMASPIC